MSSVPRREASIKDFLHLKGQSSFPRRAGATWGTGVDQPLLFVENHLSSQTVTRVWEFWCPISKQIYVLGRVITNIT